jgi:hypothetical protein
VNVRPCFDRGNVVSLASSALRAERDQVAGPIVLVSAMRIVHGLALVLWSRLMFDDGAVVDGESAGAGHANSRRAATLRLLGTFTRRLAGAKAPTHVGDGHVRAPVFARL